MQPSSLQEQLATSIDLPTRTSRETQPLFASLEDSSNTHELPHLDYYASRHSISVVLPTHNEEHTIASTIPMVLETLARWMQDFEVIVIDDASTDQTAMIVASLAQTDARLRLVTHRVHQGYATALVNGFGYARKELIFFMNLKEGFDISALKDCFPLIEKYDAVIGYHSGNQGAWMDRLAGWIWNQIIRLMLGIRVRESNCAFTLIYTRFLREHPLKARGEMINIELLYRLTQSGRTYREIGVPRLQRQSSSVTRTTASTIIHAYGDLFASILEWKREERQHIQKLLNAQRKSLERVDADK
jgi:glycosyltransferase involved in cell wall biosynthesis